MQTAGQSIVGFLFPLQPANKPTIERGPRHKIQTSCQGFFFGGYCCWGLERKKRYNSNWDVTKYEYMVQIRRHVPRWGSWMTAKRVRVKEFYLHVAVWRSQDKTTAMNVCHSYGLCGPLGKSSRGPFLFILRNCLARVIVVSIKLLVCLYFIFGLCAGSSKKHDCIDEIKQSSYDKLMTN